LTASLQHSVLEALDGAPNYNEWVASLVSPYLGDDPIEIGSGRGVFAATWLGAGVGKLTVSEVDPHLLDVLRERFATDPRVVVKALDLLDVYAAEHSCAVALNVLEHISDDVSALRSASRLVRPGGAVVVFVPAFPFAMSRFDRAIGHYRRYTAESAREAFVAGGLRVEECRYVNAPGLVAWTIGMKVLGLQPREGMALRTWDWALIPATRVIESRWRPPFGQSLLVAGRTPE
jgi:SAM-dependent methyltransferase